MHELALEQASWHNHASFVNQADKKKHHLSIKQIEKEKQMHHLSIKQVEDMGHQRILCCCKSEVSMRKTKGSKCSCILGP